MLADVPMCSHKGVRRAHSVRVLVAQRLAPFCFESLA